MGRRIVLAVLGLAVIFSMAFVLGPRVSVDTRIRFDPSIIGDDPQAYLAREEAAVPNIRDGLEKEIIWANPMVHAKTPLAMVYIHGFSASKGEVRPLPDDVADELGANLFYTRLTGHGQDGAAMAEGSVNAWINDYEEALAIGRAIGDRVIVIATSTGGSLAAWAATEPRASDGVAAIAFISPNFGVKASGAELLTKPWGKQIAELVGGKERSFPTRNALHEKFWTHQYPMAATLPMQALTELAYAAPVEKATIPALFIFSDSDRVVRPDRTREIAGRWGAPHELVPVDDTGDADNHVIAGDALSPSTTAVLAERIVVWVKALTGQ
ncbi:alpha/beta fold hydrolase [Mesorhizobium sp. M4B.F.Ca.ET.215.01.1.1]|uniref:alpha/beta hydrolase n=3 Tax=Phyllobacteriaceae TaxID=69277 RepID=UPI000FD3F2E8|nr:MULTISPECIES: alpha/beta fold hydrolase [Mesorhizobium]MDX8436544.1 alpha/beta hydrolase [Mesorhizobium abyssinicae]RUW20646.1 alpha/beta fold hydrolase [Mesorhizobium sp. M4B.F.Ca.ET.013.02.1.1]RWF29357.1 MAG: alpha/beta fold hydrolase [Mesorhizobium sp.]RWF65893.1 MAG: alpha/beta fold hydrolase [Mesorhizobium sp.]TGQ08258.1 alpha/beta fold hydrolase [Mesorhizobium sp. M4B.F.Ca.ET.215.01.1.1]